MTTLAEVEARLVGGGDGRYITGRDLIRILRLVKTTHDTMDERIDRAIERGQAALERGQQAIDAGQAFAQAADGRLDTLEAKAVITMTVVANVGALPAHAAPTAFYRVQGDAAVYIGNGPGQPLGKLIPA